MACRSTWSRSPPVTADISRESVRDEREEVVGGIGDLGVLPAGEGLHPPAGGVIVVVEDHQHLVAGEVAVRGGWREPPDRDVLELLLPAGEQPGRHVSGGGGAV